MAASYEKNLRFCILVLLNVINIIATNNESVQRVELINLMRRSEFSYDFFLHLNSTPPAIGAESNSQSQCLLHLSLILNGVIKNDNWALKFVDAWGKLPSGILYGHFMEMGNFDECLSIAEALDSDNYVEGKYCLSKIPLRAIPPDEQNGNTIDLKIGICMPAACSSDDMDIILKEFLRTSLNLSIIDDAAVIQRNSCAVSNRSPYDTVDWIAIGVLSTLGLLMFLSTFYDYFKKNLGKALNPLLAAFSIRSNTRRLLHTTSHTNSPHVIPCLNGIRSISIIWIVFGHCYMMVLLSPNVNAVDIVDWAQSPFSMFLQSGTVSVDSFFFLSGLLLALVALRTLEKNEGKLNIPMMYLHRYIRLTPVLALAVLIFMSLHRYLGNGPLWNDFTQSYKLCDDTWWATLLYVQNYAAAGKMCLGHAWYLAVDTQLYFISPLVLIMVWKWKKKGVAVLSVVGLLLFACLFSIIMLKNLLVFNKNGNLGTDNVEMRTIYYSTHTRASPWIIGIILGYFLHSNFGKQIKLPKIIIFSGWIFSLCLFFTVLFSLYAKTQPGASTITPLEGAFYLSLSRIAWPLGLCWIVFACTNGNGGVINHFLSWSFWEPFSKLSYCIYIWHFVVESVNAGRIKTNTYFSNYDVILRFWGDFGITIFVSLIMYLAVEAPMVGIEKFLFSKEKTQNTEQQRAATQSQQQLCD